jgi:hypothetical protein
MSYRNAISASDPQVAEKLAAKLEACKEQQGHMKDVNAYFRKHETCKGYPGMPEPRAAELDVRVQNAYSWEKQPYPSWMLSNNNAEIKRLERRISEITHNREVGFSGWGFEGGYVEANTDMDRLQLFFDEKPGESQRTSLKASGFKWAPSQGAWQRQLTGNAIHAAGRLDFLTPTDGRTVREHQPKPPVKSKDTGAR